MKASPPRLETGELIFALALLVAGGYSALSVGLGFHVAGIDPDTIWPLLAVALVMVLIDEATFARRRP